MQIGLVPSRPSMPCHGGTMGDALHITIPICPASRIFCAHHAAAPKWFDSLAMTSPTPCSRAMRTACPAASLRHPLADAVLPVEVQATAGLAEHPPVGQRVHFAGQQLVDVERQELDPVGVHAAQVGGYQAGGGHPRLVRRNSRALQDGFAEAGQGLDVDGRHETPG